MLIADRQYGSRENDRKLQRPFFPCHCENLLGGQTPANYASDSIVTLTARPYEGFEQQILKHRTTAARNLVGINPFSLHPSGAWLNQCKALSRTSHFLGVRLGSSSIQNKIGLMLWNRISEEEIMKKGTEFTDGGAGGLGAS